jgi:hypothetical protein
MSSQWIVCVSTGMPRAHFVRGPSGKRLRGFPLAGEAFWGI